MNNSRVFNFGAGPATLPLPVLEKIQSEFLNFQNLGASVIEISHRSTEFKKIVEQAVERFRALTSLPAEYKVLFVHGGARLQFAGIPFNLINRNSARKALYFETGYFAKFAQEEARKYGSIEVVSSSNTNYDRIPEYDFSTLAKDLSYVHLTSNNTVYGNQWQSYPDCGEIPLVVDATSDVLSRKVDFSKFGVLYASLQKNLGPSGVALVCIREDLLGKALSETPTLLDYSICAKDNSLTNTANTFAIYVTDLVLQWMQEQGGIDAIEKMNREKASLLYSYLDETSFYKTVAHLDYRSIMNITFVLSKEELLERFLKEALEEGLYALKGHRKVGGVRASIYNSMPLAGVEALVSFMKDFERQHA